MNRRTVWFLYWCGVVATLVIMGVLSIKLVVFEVRHRETLAERERRRRIDLALFRLDAQAAPILATENTRPYFHYKATYPAKEPHLAYLSGDIKGANEVQTPSPLAMQVPPYVDRYFELSPTGAVGCVGVVTTEEVGAANRYVEANQASLMTCAPMVTATDPQPPRASMTQLARSTQVAREWRVRSLSHQQQALAKKTGSGLEVDATRIVEGVISAGWVGGELVLARRVEVNGATWLQGCVLDWPALEKQLLGSIRDLVPDAHLTSVGEFADGITRDRMATLPVALNPGPVVSVLNLPGESLGSWFTFAGLWCPVLLPLWGGASILIVGLALLLRKMVMLNERQAAFVSAVTHELRTPLTTLRMYVEMQRAGMVADPERLASYMATLDRESGRLVHLVENVLAYAQLDQGRASTRLRDCIVAELMAVSEVRLHEHVERCGLSLAVDIDDAAGLAVVHTDPAAVEQILFNLVDNACKYGRSGHEPGISVVVALEGNCLAISVVDFGVGVPANFVGKLFEPFSRSGDAASGELPGVGLGLALSRRLARSLGGQLRNVPAANGARFCLQLPVVTKT